MPSRIEASVQVSAPLTLAYRRGTSFESFPDFLPALLAVHVLKNRRLRFEASVAGASHLWEARIAERVRNRRLAIESDDRVRVSGVFEFESVRRGVTHVRAEVSYELDPVRGRLLDLLIDPRRQLADGLRRFAEAVETEHANGNRASRSRRAGTPVAARPRRPAPASGPHRARATHRAPPRSPPRQGRG